MTGRAFRRWAATIVVAAGSTPLAPTAAGASTAVAACPGTTGVTAFVDFAELGGGVTGGCDRDGGGASAAEVFRDVGYTLEYSQQPGMNGFVCKVQGKPTDGECNANDSFWSLWWSDGESGRWVFSSRSVGALEIPDGGYVAWAWHEGSGRAQPPAVVPTAHPDPEPTDDAAGDDDSNTEGQGGGNQGGGTSDAAVTTSAATTAPTETTASETTGSGAAMPQGSRGDRESTAPASGTSESSVPGAAEITAGPPVGDLATDTSGDDGGALPTWIGIGLAVVVLGAAGFVTVLRRRAG